MKRYIEEIKEGSSYQESFSYSQEDVIRFSEITGDKNPLHLDDEYAAKSIFKRRIIHGYLGTSIFSKVFAMNFPGEGTIYLKQNLSFFKPMYANTKYIAKFTVIDHYKEKHRALIQTNILDNNNEVVVSGEALIKNNNLL